MNAQRFGGKYSPGGAPADSEPTATSKPTASVFRGRNARQVDVRGVLLFLLPTPLLFSAMGDITSADPVGAMLMLGAYASLMLGAWLLREGQRAEAAFEARAVARPPAFPRKLVAALLAAAGVGLAATSGWTQDLFAGLGLGALAGASHVVAFGLDPMKSKGIDISDAETSRVADALDQAEAKIDEITVLTRALRDREIEGRVDTMLTEVRKLLRQIESDPRDLTRARRYLSVYLVGAHEATRKYHENHETMADPKLRTDYLALISDLEGSFSRGHGKLLENDRTALEVEIEVLRERLGQEK